MNPERSQLLNLRRTPARLNSEEAAWYLGFLPHEIPILLAAKVLKPLGNPPITGCKYFSSTALDKLRQDEHWLAKASDSIVKYWREKNRRKTARRVATHL
jgi:hypothetical protein